MTESATSLQTLPGDLDPQHLPQHVAVIMDGNGRWAQTRHLPRFKGHEKGVEALKNLVRCCRDWGIGTLTVYAFSTENWGRPRPEVDFLMLLFERVLRKELAELIAEDVRIAFVGALDLLPPSLRQQIDQSMAATANNQGVLLNVAVNYGGRQEIIHVCKAIAQDVQRGAIAPEAIDENLFSRYLYTAGSPEPDLLIRTSGELRISNFLLWQVAYAEMYVTPTLWPDFDRQAFYTALLAYQQRQRRFGKV